MSPCLRQDGEYPEQEEKTEHRGHQKKARERQEGLALRPTEGQEAPDQEKEDERKGHHDHGREQKSEHRQTFQARRPRFPKVTRELRRVGENRLGKARALPERQGLLVRGGFG